MRKDSVKRTTDQDVLGTQHPEARDVHSSDRFSSSHNGLSSQNQELVLHLCFISLAQSLRKSQAVPGSSPPGLNQAKCQSTSANTMNFSHTGTERGRRIFGC